MKFDPEFAKILTSRVLLDVPKYGSQKIYYLSTRIKEWKLLEDKPDTKIFEIAKQYKRHLKKYVWSHDAYEMFSIEERIDVCRLLKVECDACPEEAKDMPVQSSYLKSESNDTVSVFCAEPAEKKTSQKEYYEEACRFLERSKALSPAIRDAMLPHVGLAYSELQMCKYRSELFVSTVLNLLKFESKITAHKKSIEYNIHSLLTTTKHFSDFLQKTGVELTGDNRAALHQMLNELSENDKPFDSGKLSRTVLNFFEMI